MYEKDAKERIYRLIKAYFAEEIEEATFCSDFISLYGLELDENTLTIEEQVAFSELGMVASRFIPFEEGGIAKLSVESAKQEVRVKILETKEKLMKPPDPQIYGIGDELCIELMKEKFPKFLSYWKEYIRSFGSDSGIHIQMIPFIDYALDAIRSNDEAEMKKIFDFVEFLICKGDESVQSAMTTSFLEGLMAQDPKEIKFTTFVKYMGENSIAYCRAWDKFTGIRTEGLWEDESENLKRIELGCDEIWPLINILDLLRN